MDEYGSDFLTGGTPASSNDGAGSGKENAVDNNTGTTWATSAVAFAPEWWSYDLGSGVSKKARKLRINKYVDGNGGMMRNAKLQGSNNNTDWTDILTITDAVNTAEWQEWTFANATSYRYYRVYIESTWRADGYVGFNEVEMMELIASSSVSLSASPTPSSSVSLSPSPTPSVSVSLSPSSSVSPSSSISASISPTPSSSVSLSLSPSPSLSISPSPSVSVSLSLSPSPSSSVSPSSSISPSPSVSVSLSLSPSPSVSVSLSLSPSPSLSLSPSPSSSVSPSSSISLSPSLSESLSPSSTLSPSNSLSPSPSVSVSLSPSASVSPSSSLSPSPSISESLSISLSPSPSSSVSLSPSISPSVSVSLSPSVSASLSLSLSQSLSPSISESATPSPSPSVSVSSSLSPSPSVSESQSPSITASVSQSKSPSPSPSISASKSVSASVSPSLSPSKSASISASISPSPSPAMPGNVYSREALNSLPTTKDDLATLYTTLEEHKVYQVDDQNVSLTGAANKFLTHLFKKLHDNRTDWIEVRVDLRSSLAPSSKPIYLQYWDTTLEQWVTLATNGAKQENEELSLTYLETVRFANYYYDFGNEVAFRVYQENDAIGSQSLTVNFVKISFINPYEDKYQSGDEHYEDKYASEPSEYNALYPHNNPQDDL